MTPSMLLLIQTLQSKTEVPTFVRRLAHIGVMQNILIKVLGSSLCCLMCLPALAQQEANLHLASIRAAEIKADSAFVEYVIRRILDGPQDIAFIANRELLTPLDIGHCSTDSLTMVDSLESGLHVRLLLQTKAFEASEHQIRYLSGRDSVISEIDALPAYGAMVGLPTRQIDSLAITWGDRDLIIPAAAYQNLYDPNMCRPDWFQQNIMAFPSLDEQYLYVYIFGGESSNMYFAKLIFDRYRYLKKIVTEYADLANFEVIHEGFIGY